MEFKFWILFSTREYIQNNTKNDIFIAWNAHLDRKGGFMRMDNEVKYYSKKKWYFSKIYRSVKSNWILYLFLLPTLIYVGVFSYAPMYGVQIAFKNYVPSKGIWGSQWVGLEYFIQFFQSPRFWEYVKNTLSLSFYSLLAGFPIPVILALILNDIRHPKIKKFAFL